jgi:hypothetical protein
MTQQILMVAGLFFGILYTPRVIGGIVRGHNVGIPTVLTFAAGWTLFICTKWLF